MHRDAQHLDPSIPSRLVFRSALVIVLATLPFTAPPSVADSTPGPLIQVSGASPFAGCTADAVPLQPGTNFLASEVEPWIVVNPLDPDHVVATWQQDRWSNGSARGAGVAVSFDGGLTWSNGTLPNLTLCTGGPFVRASDPWLAFGADGDLYHMSLATDGRTGRNAMVVQESHDGGLTWSDPLSLIDELPPFFNDKNTLTADPTDPDLIYATWDRLDFAAGGGPAVFTRSNDGGASFEPVRVIHDPGLGGQTIGNLIAVTPDGILLDFFNEITFLAVPPFIVQTLAFKVSFDQGQTWLPGGPTGPSVKVADMIRALGSVDPDGNGLPIREGSLLFDVAVDPDDSTLYAVWQDFRFSNGAYTSIAFSQSSDGINWSPPVAINQTPETVPPLNRQALVPSVEVNGKGRIAVTYYDFRNNGAEPEALTDYWAITCQPSNPVQTVDCTNPASWSGEIRLTDESFDIFQAPLTGSGFFLGDYVGLTASVNDFLAFFTISGQDGDPADVFIRRFDEGPERLEVEPLTGALRSVGAASMLPAPEAPLSEPVQQN